MSAQISIEEVTQFIIKVIADALSKPELIEEVNEESILVNFGIDSLVVIHLVVQLELEYGIFYEDEEMLIENFLTVSAIADLIMSKLSIKGDLIS